MTFLLRESFIRLLATVLTASIPVTTFASDDKLGHGSVSLTYQYISVDGFDSSIGELDIGTTDTHTLNFEVEYTFDNRWTVSAGLPLVRKRYNGGGAHNPATIVPPVDVDFLDDGEYHTNFQDFHVGLTYHARYGPWQFNPFVTVGVPSNNYAFFAHAAPGQRLLRSSLGSGFVYSPPFSDLYLSWSVGYEFVEETLGVDISHWRVNGELGYFLSPSLSAKVFFLGKRGGGLDFPEDLPPPRNTPLWYQHDRLIRHNYHNVGVGVDWAITDQYQLSLSVLTMTHAEQVHVMDYAVNMGIDWEF